MPLESLDHYSVRTQDIAASIDFYTAVLGLVCGPRPHFPFGGAWLYRAGEDGRPAGGSVVHLVDAGAEQADGLRDFLGDKGGPAGSGTGRLDHIAFRAADIAAMYRLLGRSGVPFRERRVADTPLHLLFVEDPSGITIELNYTGEADLAAADAHMARA